MISVWAVKREGVSREGVNGKRTSRKKQAGVEKEISHVSRLSSHEIVNYAPKTP